MDRALEEYNNAMQSDGITPSVETTNKISETVTDSAGNLLPLAKVELRSGTKTLGTIETDENGYFVFYNVPSAGAIFNIIAKYNDATANALVTKPENADVENVRITIVTR